MRTGVRLGPLGTEGRSGDSEGGGTSGSSVTGIESSTWLVSRGTALDAD